ncbi:hypothetical protein SERLA73DRAFT_81248 [Serpula lacrymans var. lacrymans S7.3]|uniref:Uncharacterized protein n=1 Tax=Serpula lacrymans var. lacrymans (strain S7.3) TaxID=936435 RepID=F8QKU7_SERL3|nr:hypothetical protein SERLA73DRAFT_81248 [Serpula lacrymans var. lacrymans S7.3]
MTLSHEKRQQIAIDDAKNIEITRWIHKRMKNVDELVQKVKDKIDNRQDGWSHVMSQKAENSEKRS